MGKESRTGIEIAIVALILGIAGDSLLRSTPWGLNVLFAAVLYVAAVSGLKYRASGSLPSPRAFCLFGGLLFFASMFAVRDADFLLFLDLVAGALIVTLLFMPSIRLAITGSGVVHYAFSGIAAGFWSLILPFVLLAQDIRWKHLASGGRSKRILLVVRGLLIATPLVLVFGALFMAADAAFEGLVENTFRVVPEELFLHAFFIALFAWPAAGYLRAVTLGISPIAHPPEEPESGIETRDFNVGGVGSVTDGSSSDSEVPIFGAGPVPSLTQHIAGEKDTEASGSEAGEVKKARPTWDWRSIDNSLLPDAFTLGPVEIGVVLGSLNLLFLIFVVVQIPYLFGGMALVQAQPGLKLAGYAQRGFGELVFASMLLLPILMALHWLLRKEDSFAEKLFRVLAAVQVGLLFVIMLSAFQRLFLLTGDLGYGMTAARFYPMAFMVWLAIVFVIFGFTVLRGERGRFAWHAAVSALLTIAALNFISPDDYIVRTNLALMREGRDFDAAYNSKLSADAVPALMASFPEFNDAQKNEVLGNLARRECLRGGPKDIRTWNLSRAEARTFGEISKVVTERGCERFRAPILGEYGRREAGRK